MKTKCCRKCGKTMSIIYFYRHSGMLDGYLNICKECTKKRIAIHREKHIDEIRLYDRIRGKTEERKAINRKNQRKNKEIHNKANRKWSGKNKHKKYCQQLAGRALKNGRITKKPCEICGSIKSVMHHSDYFKPLSVKWLCNKHHAEIHRKYKD